MTKRWIPLLLALIALMVPACRGRVQSEKQWTAAEAMVPTSAPTLADDQPAETLLAALDASLQRLGPQDGTKPVTFGPSQVPLARLHDTLRDFRRLVAEHGLGRSLYERLRRDYRFFRSAASSVLFTGYYEPLLHGARQADERYRFPLYARPDDLLLVDLDKFHFFPRYPGLPSQLKARVGADGHVVPYFSRSEIEDQRLMAGKGHEILWVDDAIDLFFLQIQGSGVVELPDGTRQRVGYAESNGHPYRSIGALLIRRGVLAREEASLQGIRDYLRRHPNELSEVLNTNPSYVFFRLSDQGPTGSLGAVLTAGRSVAADLRLFPNGAPAFIVTDEPRFDAAGQVIGSRRVARFVVVQDSGGAIRGPDRVDRFIGTGAEAELLAGHLRHRGSLYFLLKKQ